MKTFATISPAPGFRRWLEAEADRDAGIASLIAGFDSEAGDDLRSGMEKQAARYFLEARNSNDEPLDPVARFHLKNGAVLERVNVLGNPSPKGMQGAFGLMVNYVYNLAKVEDNHEKYVRDNKVICSPQVRKALTR